MKLRPPSISLFIFLVLIASLPAKHILIEYHANRVLRTAIAEATQAGNATAARLFVNEVYPRLASRLGLENLGGPGRSLVGADLAEIDRTIRKFMFGTDILKIKLYNMKGLTIYSTEAGQIGQDQSSNSGLISATQGMPGSQITHRGKFSAMEGEVFSKDLVASYIPLRTASGAVIGVAEIYTDRTPVIDQALGGEGRLHPYLILSDALQLVLLIFLIWTFRNQLLTRREDKSIDNKDF
jgi:hypothetical protein